jgi:hypothetical protein
MTLTTTLNRLKAAGVRADRYEHLVKALGGVSFDHDEPIKLLTILEHSGQDDYLWALRATVENCDQIARLMACDFAEAVLPIYEKQYPNDNRPRVCIETARRFARGECSQSEVDAAGDAAWAAAKDAWGAAWGAGAAAWGAAWGAGDAAQAAAKDAWGAAWGAARAAAWAAKDAGAARDAAWAAQLETIKRYLHGQE